jgi:hypothetical protein
VLELPVSAPGVAVAEGSSARRRSRCSSGTPRQGGGQRIGCGAHDHGWVVVARGDLSGSVTRHAEAFFKSMAAAVHSARAITSPPGTVLEWSPGLTVDQYEPGGDRAPFSLAWAKLPGSRGRAARRGRVARS